MMVAVVREYCCRCGCCCFKEEEEEEGGVNEDKAEEAVARMATGGSMLLP